MVNQIEELVKEAKKGNKEAFGKLFELTNQRAYYTALKITNNPKDAEDMVQEAYIKAFSSITSLKDDSRFEKWLNKIVANKCRDLSKKHKPDLFSDYESGQSDVSFEDSIENSDASFHPDEVTDKKAIEKIVMDCIDKLPSEQKDCILMYYYDELSVSEIANKLSIPEGTVKSRLFKARSSLKKQFQDIEKQDNIKMYSASLSGFIKAIGLSTAAKRIIAGVGAAAIITGGSLAAKEVIDKKNEVSVSPSTTISQAVTEHSTLKSTTKKSELSSRKQKTTKSKKKKEKVKIISSALAVTDGNDNTYYINNKGVYHTDEKGKNTKLSSHKPLNLCVGSSLYYIYNGSLCRVKESKSEKIMEVKGDYLYGDKSRLISITKDKNKAYIIDVNEKKCIRFEKNSSDFKYIGKKLYFRSPENEIKRSTVNDSEIKTEKVVRFNEEDDLMMNYCISQGRIWYTGFDSDETGNIFYKEIGSNKPAVRLYYSEGIKDFTVSDGRVYFSTTKGNLCYLSQSKGYGFLAYGNFYCSATSKGNMIWCSSDDETAYLLKSGESEFYEIKNGKNILEFSVIDDIMYYRTEKGYGKEELKDSFSQEIEFFNRDDEKTGFEYWAVPLSSQIKLGFNKDISDWVDIYIAKEGEEFEYLDTTDSDYYIIDNLSHRKNYRIKLVVNQANTKFETEAQTLRVK